MASHEEIRLGRLHKIKATLIKAKDPDYEKLIAQGCMEWGCSRRTMQEYIKVVKLTL